MLELLVLSLSLRCLATHYVNWHRGALESLRTVLNGEVHFQDHTTRAKIRCRRNSEVPTVQKLLLLI
jgi:hypothetical protein